MRMLIHNLLLGAAVCSLAADAPHTLSPISRPVVRTPRVAAANAGAAEQELPEDRRQKTLGTETEAIEAGTRILRKLVSGRAISEVNARYNRDTATWTVTGMVEGSRTRTMKHPFGVHVFNANSKWHWGELHFDGDYIRGTRTRAEAERRTEAFWEALDQVEREATTPPAGGAMSGANGKSTAM